MTKTCLFCAYWKPEGTIKGITRKGGKCLLTDKESKLEASCWGWKACSTKQLEQRKWWRRYKHERTTDTL